MPVSLAGSAGKGAPRVMAPFRWRWRSCGRRGRADRRARALECGWRGRPTRCCESGRRAHRADAGAVRDVRDAWAAGLGAREQSGRLRSSHRALVDARGCAPQKNGDLRILVYGRISGCSMVCATRRTFPRKLTCRSSRFAARLASPGPLTPPSRRGALELIEGRIPGAHPAGARSSLWPRSAP
jgi:hypothetical protein